MSRLIRIPVPLEERAYDICMADTYAALVPLLKRLGYGPQAWIISHPWLLRRFGSELMPRLERAGWQIRTLTVPESELSKSLSMAQRLIGHLAEGSRLQTPLLLAFGGGVVGDLAGFVAAVFRRGIPYVQLPTTLLAQVDSAIGGKVGVDLPAAKNAVGAFYQPALVFDHLGLLRHLPPRQRRSGLSEIIKYAAIADPELWTFLERRLDDCLAGQPDADRVMVSRCSRIKAKVVAQDERDIKGVRTQLNFGHTLGHALEAATGYRRFTHGEAIAVGMACAAQLSLAMELLTPATAERLTRLLARAGLPRRAPGVRLTAVRRALLHDKKFLHGRMRWVLWRGIGHVAVRDDVPTGLIWRTIRRHLTDR
ncbi:MAG: 3-dehydroquinate synthase [Candidatus Omnitrophica bacterium]|nr:3-dehydroquinate synthase [Candidatus Omnitrophota bacterium]